MFDWKPAKGFEMSLNVVTLSYSKDKSGCSVLYTLEFREKSVRNANKKGISIVYSRKNKRINNTLSGMGVQKVSNLADAPRMVEGSFPIQYHT
jgi:hypothetical protein